VTPSDSNTSTESQQTMMARFCIVLFALSSLFHASSAFTSKILFTGRKECRSRSISILLAKTTNEKSRLAFLSDGLVALAGFMAGSSSFLHPSNAVTASAGGPTSEKADKDNIIKGYKRLSYLLDNWDKETMICNKKNDSIIWDECDRSPEKVMEYLGYKSMNDPLFKADKTIKRLQSLVPEEADDEYQEAYLKWMEKAEEGKDMAYVSSWGEANPGGGLDVKAAYIERSKKDVEEARESLATVIRILGLKVE